MAQQEEGWPLGLQPLNGRAGLVRNREINDSLSFNTLLTGSSVSSTDSSSDLDTESTGSFFHDKSITLGHLIGISSILELSRRSIRGQASEPARNKKNYKTRTWFLSLCSKLTTDAVTTNSTTAVAPSLGQFLRAERRAADSYRRNDVSLAGYGPDDFSSAFESNSLFVGGHVVPPRSGSNRVDPIMREGSLSRDLLSHGNGDGELLLSRLCGNLAH